MAKRQAAIDATQMLDRAYAIQVGNQSPEVEGLVNQPTIDLPEAYSDESNSSNVTVITFLGDQEEVAVERMPPHGERYPTSAVRSTYAGSARKRRKTEEENMARRNLSFNQTNVQVSSNYSPARIEARNGADILSFKDNISNALTTATPQVFASADDIIEDDVDESNGEEEEDLSDNADYDDNGKNEVKKMNPPRKTKLFQQTILRLSTPLL